MAAHPAPSPDVLPDGLPVSPTLPTLRVSGVFLSKAQLLAALRLFVPQLTDIEPVPGDRYLLHFGEPPEVAPTPLERSAP